MAQEEVTFATAGTSGSMMLPRDLVESVIPNAARFHGTVMRDGAARILAQYILSVGETFADVPVGALPAIASASVDLALGCLRTSLRGDDTLPADAFHRATRQRIDHFIDQRLGDPALGAEQIQTELGLSRSAVYRLFESSHGVARYIKARRLTRIRAILLENRDPRTLATLAADFGFQSSAHFSREFHRQFGCSPSEMRAGRSLQAVPAGSDGSLGAFYRSIQS
jgi:AraC-like DNA-binding protein